MRRSPLLSIALLVALAAIPIQTYGGSATPLYADNFQVDKIQGFGDRHNSQTWSMLWFNGELFVGTGRATYCTTQATLNLFRPDLGVYPPNESDVECTEDPHDLPLQAQIWRWTPETNIWTMVYESPNDVPIEGTDKFTARDIGYRGMAIFPEPGPGDTTIPTLYVSGVSSRGGGGIGFNGPVPPPRILRSPDGENFYPVPQEEGTFLGDTLASGFRGIEVYNGKLYILASNGSLGHGVILESETPWRGNDSFRKISPDGMTFFEIKVYNGYLWAGTGVQPLNDDTPFSLLKTTASGDLPYTFTTVIPEGGYKQRNPSAAVISLHEFKDRLYVGTDRELFVVNPDDSWEIVVGTKRRTPEGLKAPLSGLDIGFDNVLNIHMWRMHSEDGWLYIGTHDQSTKWRNNPFVGKLLEPSMGFDLYATNDGWHYTLISRDGFGDYFNSGVRNFANTPYGLFMGSANHYYGTRIYRGTRSPRAPKPMQPPQNLEVEKVSGGYALSWGASPDVISYHVYRSHGFRPPKEIRELNHQLYDNWIYVDIPDNLWRRYRYYVVGEDNAGNRSGPSNIVRAPSRGLVPTFKMMRDLLEPAPDQLSDLLRQAQQAVSDRDYDGALASLMPLRRMLMTHRGLGRATPMSRWWIEDTEMLLAKLVRRVQLARAGVIGPSDLLR